MSVELDHKNRVVFAVGSMEDRFIVDRVYSEQDFYSAFAYCNQRNAENLEMGFGECWVIMSAPLGEPWVMWDVVHCKKYKGASAQADSIEKGK